MMSTVHFYRYRFRKGEDSMLPDATPPINTANMVQLLKGDDVAKILNISRTHAFALMQRGEIATLRLGRSRRVRVADLEAFIERNLHHRADQG
jgi:excisionase family DNA binding protein